MILTVGNIKGGVGKSTISCNIAVSMSLSGMDVLLIDGDKQGSSSDFIRARIDLFGESDITCIRGQGKEIINQVNSMREKFDHIIIDAGGQDNPSLRAGLVSSDRILVPVSPRSFETWALDGMVDLIEEASITNPKLQSCAILNFAFPRGHDNDQTESIIKEDFPILTPLAGNIVQRKVFSDSIGLGKSVLEFKPQNIEAITELIETLKGIGLNENDIKVIYNDSTT